MCGGGGGGGTSAWLLFHSQSSEPVGGGGSWLNLCDLCLIYFQGHNTTFKCQILTKIALQHTISINK